ncbi:hypothetical protein F2Q69_00017290 [Brassica cretica]|uniref:Uncharacterized protein n=1 Tax=Brassica cretica TaxID=69181 RepID=A0A8S9QTF0_BRACR|nr:hypothetical protein F2Q69_00017290 [Brassica cretica]
MDHSPYKESPLRKKKRITHHVSDHPAINEYVLEHAPPASTGTRKGRGGAPPTVKSKQLKPINQSGLHEARTEETNWRICKTKKKQTTAYNRLKPSDFLINSIGHLYRYE